MTAPARPDYLEFADYTGPLRRRWLTVVLLAVIGVAIGAGVYVVSPKAYTATVVVFARPLPQSANAVGGRTTGVVNMDNEAQLVQSAHVTSIAVGAPTFQLPRASGLVQGQQWQTSGLTSYTLLPHVTVAVPPNTNFLDIGCTMASAQLAQSCANSMGYAYLSNRRETVFNEVSAQLIAYQGEANLLQSGDSSRGFLDAPRQTPVNIEYLQHVLNNKKLTGAPRYADNQLLGSLKGRLATVYSKMNPLTPLRASLAAQNSSLVGDIVTLAKVPTVASSPRKLLDVPGGLALGLVVGLPLAYYLDRRRPRVHATRDIERRLDVPSLVSLTGRSVGNATAPAAPRSEAGQAFTELAQYVARSLGDGNHVVLVAGTSDGTGGSAVAANLAVALARTRADTIVICADLRRSRVPQLLSVADGRGLAELISGSAAVSEVLRGTPEADRLGVITAGTDIASVLYTLDYDAARQLVAELHRQVRYLVIEVRCGDGDGTFGLAEFADAAILAAELGSSELAAVADCVSRLDRMRTPVLGAVVLPAGKRPVARPLGDDSRRPRRKEPIAPEPASLRQRADRPAQPEAARTVAVSPPAVTTMRPVASAKPRSVPATAPDADTAGPTSRPASIERNGGFPASNRPYGDPPADFDSVVPGLRSPAEAWQHGSGKTRPAADEEGHGAADPGTSN